MPNLAPEGLGNRWDVTLKTGRAAYAYSPTLDSPHFTIVPPQQLSETEKALIVASRSLIFGLDIGHVLINRQLRDAFQFCT